MIYMGVSKDIGTPKSSILIGFSIINHPFWVPLFLETSIWEWIIHSEQTKHCSGESTPPKTTMTMEKQP